MEVNVHVSPSLHPDVVRAIKGYTDETADAVADVVNAFEAAYAGFTKAHAARRAAKENPTLTEAAQILVAADYTEKQFDKIAAKLDAALVRLKGSIADAERQLRQPLDSAAVGGWTGEIRAHVRGLSPSERRLFLDGAVAGQDTKTLGAVLGAPPFLSGLAVDDRDTYLRKFHERTNHALAKRLDVMKAAELLIYRNGVLIHDEVEKAIGVTRARVASLRAARAKAEKAFTV